uniref:Uncharacterized protein n=1 Tax=Caenorhabditis japonica TaxID=281687 RepID=A0A8R1I507_CAEJA
MTISPSTSSSSIQSDSTDIPVPKPRRILNPIPKKAPVPSPRKSLLKAKSEERPADEEGVRLRKHAFLIRRETYRPIFIEREKLQRILEVSEPEWRTSRTRPASFPSSSLDISLYDNVESSVVSRKMFSS